MGFSNSKFATNVRLDGKTAVVTGANTGIGKVTARELYKIGARVIMACRDNTRANTAMEEIKAESKDSVNVGELLVKHLDLSSLESVRECAKDILSSEQNIHLLVNNAGIMMCPKSETKDGFEMQFGVNHLGHFLFTNLLLPMIISSAPARIVNVSSRAHERGSMHWDDLNFENTPYSAMGAYSQSKLANVLFSLELSKKLEGTGVTTYALHPGVVKTELGRYLDDTYFPGSKIMARIAMAPFFKTPDEGALTTLHCCLDEVAGQENGLYYSDCKVKQASAAGRNLEQAKKLWEESVKLVKLEETCS